MSHRPAADTATTDTRTVSPSQAVVEAVAEAEGVDETELDPLFSVCDPDALDALFTAPRQKTASTRRVRFQYHGYEVSVGADGEVRLGDR